MKKTLLAAALLAGFAGAAQAQSNVTLYGIVDGGFNYTKVDGKTTKGFDSGLMGQSRWGIRGTEDIGNGLKALFVLENGFTVDNGNSVTYGSSTNKMFGRYAYVGLESATAGRVTLGRTTNFGFAWASGIVNPFGLSFGTATLGTTFAYQDADFGGGRVDNSLYYYSPIIAGFQGGVGYSFAPNSANTVANGGGNEVAGSKNNDRLIDLGLKYDNGPLKAALTYEYLTPSEAAANNGKIKNLTVGGNYDFGIAAVFVGYAKANNLRTGNGLNGVTGFVTPTRNDDNAYTVGLTAPVGPGKAYAAFQRATKSDVSQWAVGYTYDLSKRTNLYAFFADTDYRNFTQNRDYSGRQFALGLQHRF